MSPALLPQGQYIKNKIYRVIYASGSPSVQKGQVSSIFRPRSTGLTGALISPAPRLRGLEDGRGPKAEPLVWVFSGRQVIWRAGGGCNRREEEKKNREEKQPWRHLRLPDDENSNYTGKSIFNPISVPYRPGGSSEVEKVPEKFIPQILLADIYGCSVRGRHAPRFHDRLFIFLGTEHESREQFCARIDFSKDHSS